MLTTLSSFYWLLLPKWLAENLWYADWQRARRRGWGAVVWELVRSCLGLNAYALFVSDENGVSGRDIAGLLWAYGIPTWGWVWGEGGVLFHVRPRQARFALDILHKRRIWAEG